MFKSSIFSVINVQIEVAKIRYSFYWYSKVYGDSTEEKDGKFSIFDKHTKLWRVYKHKKLYRIFATSICNFITDHIEDLNKYRERLSEKEWRYSEIYTTDCLNINILDKDRMANWNYWKDSTEWHQKLFEEPRFVLEDIDDPTVRHALYLDCQHVIRLDDNSRYNCVTDYSNYDYNIIMDFDCNDNKNSNYDDSNKYIAGWNLADRYRHHYTYLFDKHYIYQPRIFAPDNMIDDLKLRIDRQILDLERIHRRLLKGLFTGRCVIVRNILSLVSSEGVSSSTIRSSLHDDNLVSNTDDTSAANEDNTPTSESQCLIAVADQQVLDLTTLRVIPRTSEHNMLSACKQQWYSGNNYPIREIDTVLGAAFDDSDVYLQLMSTLGLALLCLPAPNRYLYIISCPQSVRTTLKALLSSTLGDLYGEGKAATLIGDTLDAEYFAELAGRRLVVFDTLYLSQPVSEGVLEAYFSERTHKTIGGKCYATNTSFLLLTSKVLPIDKLVLRDYDSHALIYYFSLDTLNADKLCNIKVQPQQDKGKFNPRVVDKSSSHSSRGNSPARNQTISKNKAAAITIAANTGLQHLFFTSLVVSANTCYNRIRDAEFEPPYLPEELLEATTTSKPVKSHIYKHPTSKAAEKELFLDFMRSRVIIETGKEQSADEFRDNLYVYLDEVGGDPTSFTPSGLGKRLTNYLKDKAITDVTTNIREISGKTHRVYLGLQSYDYDLSA